MLRDNCQIDQSAMTVANCSIPYGWPCVDGKICNGNFITGPYWNGMYVDTVFVSKHYDGFFYLANETGLTYESL